MMRWVWRGLLLVLAVVAIGAQLDRASQARPELSLFVPTPFRSFAQAPIALLALTGGDGRRAEMEARRLVRRRPLPAEHLFTLAMADMRAGRPRAFAADFRAASTRGWRFAPLQVTAAQAALANRDMPGAANRIAALWAGGGDDPSLEPLTTTLLSAPGGAEAFAVPLAQTRVWANNFLAHAPSYAPPAVISKLMRSAAGRGARFDCDELERLDRALAIRDPGRAALAVPCKS